MYKRETIFKDNERPAKYNVETGQYEILPSGHKSNNGDIINFKTEDQFIKIFPKAWEFLYLKTTPLEFKVAQKMSTMIKMMTNSLEPLDDEYTYQQLADEFSISKTKAIKVFKRLFELGVYGKFEVYDSNHKHTKYWVLNPYLAINGKAISKTTLNLFSTTDLSKVK